MCEDNLCRLSQFVSLCTSKCIGQCTDHLLKYVQPSIDLFWICVYFRVQWLKNIILWSRIIICIFTLICTWTGNFSQFRIVVCSNGCLPCCCCCFCEFFKILENFCSQSWLWQFFMWSVQLLLLPKSELFWRMSFHDTTWCTMYWKSCHVDNLHCWIRYCIH